MPKKFAGTNTKAVEARARKNAQKVAENDKKAAAAEDEYWRDDDKVLNRKLQRKEEKEKKRVQQLDKKKELQTLHDEEMNQLKCAKPAPAVVKVTRSDIAGNVERQNAKLKRTTKTNEDDLPPLEENLNHMMIEGEARTVDEAIGVLVDDTPEADIHPEKRVKAAFKKFEEKRLPILKRENPNLRLTQVKQLLQKEWMKSLDNPLVQLAMKN